jgi:hypothetical protein
MPQDRPPITVCGGKRCFIETANRDPDVICLSGNTGQMKPIRMPGHARNLNKLVPGQLGRPRSHHSSDGSGHDPLSANALPDAR